MAIIALHEIGRCPNCGGDLNITFGQTDDSPRVAWFRSSACTKCEYSVQEDGWDYGLEDDPGIRARLLQENGVFALFASSAAQIQVARLRVMQLMGWSANQVLELRRIHPLCVASGTQMEMSWLQRQLSTKADVCVRRIA